MEIWISIFVVWALLVTNAITFWFYRKGKREAEKEQENWRGLVERIAFGIQHDHPLRTTQQCGVDYQILGGFGKESVMTIDPDGQLVLHHVRDVYDGHLLWQQC